MNSILIGQPKNSDFRIRALKIPYRNSPRDFDLLPSREDYETIRYILDFLANSSLLTISYYQDSLQETAEKLDHLHPLRILAFICDDQELLYFLHKIRGRSFVWGDLFDKYCDSLNQESNFNNIHPHAKVFAQLIHIDSKHLTPFFKQRNWKEFFAILLETHPSP